MWINFREYFEYYINASIGACVDSQTTVPSPWDTKNGSLVTTFLKQTSFLIFQLCLKAIKGNSKPHLTYLTRIFILSVMVKYKPSAWNDTVSNVWIKNSLTKY